MVLQFESVGDFNNNLDVLKYLLEFNSKSNGCKFAMDSIFEFISNFEYECRTKLINLNLDNINKIYNYITKQYGRPVKTFDDLNKYLIKELAWGYIFYYGGKKLNYITLYKTLIALIK